MNNNEENKMQFFYYIKAGHNSPIIRINTAMVQYTSMMSEQM